MKVGVCTADHRVFWPDGLRVPRDNHFSAQVEDERRGSKVVAEPQQLV